MLCFEGSWLDDVGSLLDHPPLKPAVLNLCEMKKCVIHDLDSKESPWSAKRSENFIGNLLPKQPARSRFTYGERVMPYV
jgi:hypothetical protein